MNLNYQFSWRELARQLTEDLLTSSSTALAGVDALGKQYKVSRLTVKRALSHLEEIGIIAPAERGKKRKVNLRKLHKVASLQNPERANNRIVFLTVSPESNPTYETRFHFEIFHKLCDQERLLLTYIQVPPDAAELRALLSSLKPRGAILFCVSLAVSEIVISLAIPSIQLGGHEDLELPRFYTSHEKLLINALEQAAAAGHQRITAPMTFRKSSVYKGSAMALEKHFSAGSMSFTRRYNFPLVSGSSTKDYHEMLRRLFRYTPPSCIILHDLSEYLMAISFFLKEGLSIPDDISVILLTYDPAFENIVPSTAHYELFSDAEALTEFSVLMEQINGFLSHEQIETQPNWVPGDSLAYRIS